MGTSAAWRFRPSPIDGGRTGGDQAAMNFSHDLETFAREVLQNSLDARRRDLGHPMRARFRVVSMEGRDKRAMLDALGWKDLKKHLLASSALRPSLGDAVSRAESNAPLVSLVVHDGGALGLSGPERGVGRFATFARNKLLSDKASGDAGGSFGLGKSVLWANSGWSTILAHSHPVSDQGAPEAPRFLGISQLPFHEVGGAAHDGPGWFGEERRDANQRWSGSFQPDSPLLRALSLDRPAGFGTGTSLLVPDFTATADFDPSLVLMELAKSAAKFFWPSMAAQKPWLLLEVQQGDDVRAIDPASFGDIRPFLHLAGFREEDDWKDRTRRSEQPLKLPASAAAMEERPDFRAHPAMEVPDAIALSVVELERDAGELTGHLALMRGAGMIVKYAPIHADRPVCALAQAGASRGGRREDALVEQFLRNAEPPSHDDWTSSAPKLHERYSRGYVGELRGLTRRLTEAGLKLLRTTDSTSRTDEIPAALKKALSVKVPSQGGRQGRGGRFDHRITRCVPRFGDDPGWTFEGWAQSTREGPWMYQVECSLVGDAQAVQLPVAELVVDGAAHKDPARSLRFQQARRSNFVGFCPIKNLGDAARLALFSVRVRGRMLLADPADAPGSKPAAGSSSATSVEASA